MNRHDRKNSKEYADLKTGSLFWLDPIGGAEFPPGAGMPGPPSHLVGVTRAEPVEATATQGLVFRGRCWCYTCSSSFRLTIRKGGLLEAWGGPTRVWKCFDMHTGDFLTVDSVCRWYRQNTAILGSLSTSITRWVAPEDLRRVL